jgi:hypothetical protein
MGRTGFNWLRVGSSGGLLSKGDEPSGSIRKDIFDKLSDNQLLK